MQTDKQKTERNTSMNTDSLTGRYREIERGDGGRERARERERDIDGYAQGGGGVSGGE